MPLNDEFSKGLRCRYGGFYSQDDIREIVSYATDRFVEVVPEIEMPGHCCAALACYPELSCTGNISEVPTQWGVQSDVYCAGASSVAAYSTLNPPKTLTGSIH